MLTMPRPAYYNHPPPKHESQKGANKTIHIGTSGWHYGHWVGPFYPPGTAQKDFLTYYAGHFHTVEINSSFYRLPEKKTFELWRDATPGGFIFAVKASRFITHMKKLKDPERSLATFMERISGLKEKLGPILFQLPPYWRRDIERLEAFLAALPSGYRYAFEFRDPTWFHPEVYQALAEHEAAFCLYELAGLSSPRELTADFTYLRLHGPGDAYSGCYPAETLSQWADVFGDWAKEGKEIYCYFDNDELGYAAQNAAELQKLVTQKAESK
jgi:uncharacterized protein YecE (DUF72 family)